MATVAPKRQRMPKNVIAHPSAVLPKKTKAKRTITTKTIQPTLIDRLEAVERALGLSVSKTW